MDKPKPDELVDELLAKLNEPDDLDELQDASDDQRLAAEEILKKRGYTGEEEDWDDIVEELATSVIYSPARFSRAEQVNLNSLEEGA